MKHTVLPDIQPTTAAFTLLVKLFGPKADETQTGATIFAKNSEGKNFALAIFDTYIDEANRFRRNNLPE